MKDKATEKGLVCCLCKKPLTDETCTDIKTPKNHYGYGMAATITVCKACAISAD